MKKIYEYVQDVQEGRTPGAKNKKKEELEDYSHVKPGKDADHNGTGGKFAIDEPAEDELLEPLDPESISENKITLLEKFDAEEPFFIIGRAGWGKTSIVKEMAKRFKRKVITVYLDKAVATDLGGIPVPVQGKTGAAQELAMPQWAKYMEDRPDEQFLLFFDEMNQAQPDVMNALMPIVLETEICGRKFNNFFVGAAGNFESENGAVNELSGPLKSRFKPLIEWETGTPEAWKESFDFLRKKWKGQATDALMDKLADNYTVFDNPREVDMKIIQFVIKIKQSAHANFYKASNFLKRLQGLAKDDLSRTEQAQLAEVADAMFDFVNDKGETKKGRSANKNRDMIPKQVLDAIKAGMKNGYIPGQTPGDKRKYGISRENITTLADEDDGVNPEMIQRAVDKFEAEGIKFKFEKNEDWQKAGYSDPDEE